MSEIEPAATPPRGWALVTGASRGIGAAAARLLAADGWPVAVNYRADAEGAERVAAGILAQGGRARALRADVRDADAVDAMFAELEAAGDPVLVLVNNAGLRADAMGVHLEEAAWAEALATNLSGAYRTTRRALAAMIGARWGRIVNVASVAGVRASSGQAGYSAAKAGLIGFTKTIAVEVAARGVTVNAVAPGFVPTAFNADVGSGLLAAIPARRAGSVREVASCIRFLASPDAAYVTGATLVVDGGLTA